MLLAVASIAYTHSSQYSYSISLSSHIMFTTFVHADIYMLVSIQMITWPGTALFKFISRVLNHFVAISLS